MVKKSSLQEAIPIPAGLSDAQRVELARRIVTEVRARTKRGISATGSTFPNYSKTYKSSLDFKNAGKSSKVNLTSTGDMLAELDVISISSSHITIGYNLGDELAGQVEGNTIGSYGKSTGNNSKKRDFIGLPTKIVTRLVAELQQDTTATEETEASNSIIDSILGGI